MAKGKNSPITNSNKGGGSKAALRAEQEAAVKAVKAAEKSRRKAIAAEKLLKAKAANDAREAEREAAMKTDAADLLAGIAGEYKFAVHGTEVVDDMEVARTFDVRAEVFYHGDKPMFRLQGQAMGIPVAMLRYKTPADYVPLDGTNRMIAQQMKVAFDEVYCAVKPLLDAKAVTAKQAPRKERKAATPEPTDAPPLSFVQKAELFARKAHKGATAAMHIGAGLMGQYDLDGIVIAIYTSGPRLKDDKKGDRLKYIGCTKQGLRDGLLTGVRFGTFMPLDLLRKEKLELLHGQTVKLEIQQAQAAIHQYVREFCARHGVKAKTPEQLAKAAAAAKPAATTNKALGCFKPSGIGERAELAMAA